MPGSPAPGPTPPPASGPPPDPPWVNPGPPPTPMQLVYEVCGQGDSCVYLTELPYPMPCSNYSPMSPYLVHCQATPPPPAGGGGFSFGELVGSIGDVANDILGMMKTDCAQGWAYFGLTGLSIAGAAFGVTEAFEAGMLVGVSTVAAAGTSVAVVGLAAGPENIVNIIESGPEGITLIGECFA